MAIRKTSKPPAPATQTAPLNRTTGINLPAEMWDMLNRVAFERARKGGRGRPSVSALLVQLVERHRKELEKDLNH